MRTGCGIKGMTKLPRASCALVLTDPPSGETRAVFDKKISLTDFWDAAWHVSKLVVIMASSIRFAREVIDSQDVYFKYELVWSKSVATGFLNAKKRPLRAHEYILIFAKGPHTYNPQMVEGATPIHAARRRSHGENYGPMTKSTESRAGATDRYPTSVLEFGSVGTSAKERIHPQQKPVPLLRWLIRTFSNPGDRVVDPFAGSGSTIEAAHLERRRAIGFELNLKRG